MTDLLLATPNLDDLLRQLVERAREIVPFESGGIAIYDPDTHEMTPRIYEGDPVPGVINRIVDTREAILIDDLTLAIDSLFHTNGSTNGKASARAAGAMIAAPLLMQERILGVFVARSFTPHAYRPEHLKILQTLADQGALLLHTSQLYAILSRRYKRLSSYNEELFLRNELSRMAASDMPLEAQLPQMLRHLTTLVGANACALTLWDRAEGRPIRFSGYGIDLGDYISARRRPAGMPSLTEEIVNTGKPVIINNALALDNPPTPLIAEYEVHGLLAMPLIARSQVIGSVFLLKLTPNDEPFTQVHAERVAAVLDQIALTIDNRMLLQDLQDRLSETTALLEIASLASSNPNADEMLAHVLKLSRQMLGVTAGGFLLYDRHNHTLNLHPSGHFGIPDTLSNLRFQVNEPGSHVALVFNSGTPYYTNDTRTATHDSQEPYRSLIEQLGLRNLMLAPLRVQNDPLGVVLVGNKRGDLTRGDAQLLMAMGSHIAAALRNNDLLHDMRQRLRETDALQQVAAITSSTLDLDEMLERAVRQAAELLETEGALLMMPDEQSSKLIPHNRSRYGIAGSITFQPLALDSTDHIVQVYKSGQPHISNDTAGKRGSIITFPLSVRNRTLGTLSLINRKIGRFGETQIELMRAIASQIATSMENAQLFAAERQRADLTALVNQISQELTATLSMSDLTRKVVTLIHERLGYPTVHIMLIDEGGSNVVVRSSVSVAPDMVIPEGYQFPITRGIVGRAVRTGETQLVPNVAADPEFYHFQDTPIGSLLTVPVRYGTRTLGVIEAVSSRVNAFRDSDCLALETLAAQVSIALENARLWDQARKRLLEQGIVHQISQDLSKILDYGELVTAIARHMGRALDTALCLLISHDAATSQLNVEAEYRPPEMADNPLPPFVGQALSPAEHTVVERAIRTRRQVLINRDAERVKRGQSAYVIHAQLVMPMIAGDRVIGCVLWLETRGAREFSGSDIRLAQTLVTQASIAIENARLYRQAQRQAHEQTLLRRVAVGLSTMPDVETMLEQFAYEIVQALDGVNNVAIAMRDTDGRFRVQANYLTTCGPSDTLLAHLLSSEESESALLAAVETGASLEVGSTIEAEPPLDEFLHPILRDRAAALLTPIMRRRREIIGIMEVSVDGAARIFQPYETQLLEALANQGAIAYDNISFHAREQRRLRQLEKLQVSSRSIAGQLDTNLLLDTIVNEAARIFEVPAVSLMTREAGSDHYTTRAAVGLSEEYVRSRKALVYEFESPHIFTSSEELSGTLDDEQRHLIAAEDLASVLSVPLIKGDQQLGLLNLYSKGELRLFTDEEKGAAHLFAGQAAIALENATLFKALEDRAVELMQANRLKSEFLARVSHELRTPMNSINGYSEMLLRNIYGPINEKQGDRIERILRNGKNLLAIIDDLLDISKIDAGKMELHIEAVNLRDEIEATFLNLESQATARGLYLNLEAPPTLPPVHADAIRLRQVITNLLSNALKFTKQGGITVRVQPVDEESGPTLWTTVIDTGIGIRKEHQAIIFDEFRQADGSTTREYGGTGLGLAITRKLLEMMHGRIWVESEPGQGSAFTFVIPVATEPPAAE